VYEAHFLNFLAFVCIAFSFIALKYHHDDYIPVPVVAAGSLMFIAYRMKKIVPLKAFSFTFSTKTMGTLIDIQVDAKHHTPEITTRISIKLKELFYQRWHDAQLESLREHRSMLPELFEATIFPAIN